MDINCYTTSTATAFQAFYNKTEIKGLRKYK